MVRLLPLCLGALLISSTGCDESLRSVGDTGAPSDPSDPNTEPHCEGAPLVLAGTGERSWTALNNGDSVQVINGPQGGWHVVGALQAHNLGEIVDIDFSITDVDSWQPLASARYRVQLVHETPCIGFFPGMLAIFDPSLYNNLEENTLYERLYGHNLLLKMTVQGEFGEASDEVVVQPRF